MAEISLRILDGQEACDLARLEDFEKALARKTTLVFLANTGGTPIGMYRRIGESGLDLSRVRLRMLDAYLSSPSRGFSDTSHPACFTRYVAECILAPIAEARRPVDWAMLPEDLTTCEAVDEALAASPDDWESTGAAYAIDSRATGVLGALRSTSQAYDRLLAQAPPDIASLGVGPMPYPHMAFNCGPRTPAETRTHLTALDDATRDANAAGFGETPPFALTVGPANVVDARVVWITAFGSKKADALAWALGDPRAPDFDSRSSLGYALGAEAVSIVIDEDAAAGLWADGGAEGLVARYAEAGHRLVTTRC